MCSFLRQVLASLLRQAHDLPASVSSVKLPTASHPFWGKQWVETSLVRAQLQSQVEAEAGLLSLRPVWTKYRDHFSKQNRVKPNPT